MHSVLLAVRYGTLAVSGGVQYFSGGVYYLGCWLRVVKEGNWDETLLVGDKAPPPPDNAKLANLPVKYVDTPHWCVSVLRPAPPACSLLIRCQFGGIRS